MIQLPHGNRRSELSVNPSDWNAKRPNEKKLMAKPWYIIYWFYQADGTKKQVMVKRMNRLLTYGERKEATQLLKDRIEADLSFGYNPISGKMVFPEPETTAVIDPETPFFSALRLALTHLTIEQETRDDIRRVIEGCRAAAEKLSLTEVPISEVKRRHIKMILEQCYPIRENFTDNTYNQFRKYLAMLFTELNDMEAVEGNPALALSKKEVVKKQRLVLSETERGYVDDLLRVKVPGFHRFLHIFFHSGARIRELLRLKGEDVDLAGQRWKCVVKKGKAERVVYRTIKDMALPFWIEQMQDCAPDQYVFSSKFLPGPDKSRNDYPSKCWYRHVKKQSYLLDGKIRYKERFHLIEGKQVQILADFYALKHLHTTEVVSLENEQMAATFNAQTSTAMVVKIYDVKQQERQHQKIKGLNVPFVK